MSFAKLKPLSIITALNVSVFGVFSSLYFSAFRLNMETCKVFSLNVGKYGPEKLRIKTLFTKCILSTITEKPLMMET